MDALRLFLAIDIPPFAKEKITEVQNRFKKLDMDVAWVKPSNIHLTLKFLGDTDPRKLPVIKDHMLNRVSPSPQFSVSLEKIGVFPNIRKPHILWIGLKDTESRLVALQKMIDDEVARIGFASESRPFLPHLTFGRVKSKKGTLRLGQEIQALGSVKSDPFAVSSVRLYQSRLTQKGAVYTVLEDFPLHQPTLTN